jgi:hypothetical protein
LHQLPIWEFYEHLGLDLLSTERLLLFHDHLPLLWFS